MKIYDIKVQFPEDFKHMELVLTLDRSTSNTKEVQDIRAMIASGKLVEVFLKEIKKKRSLDANAYCWVISQKIAKVIGSTKEIVYREAIKRVGPFEILPIKDDSVDRWITAWESKGLGWHSEVYPSGLLEGYTRTINYFGSSIYTVEEMSFLIEELVYEAKELGIDTITPDEQAALVASWKGV